MEFKDFNLANVTKCEECFFFNHQFFRCKKYNEPLPCNLKLEAIRLRECMEANKNEG